MHIGIFKFNVMDIKLFYFSKFEKKCNLTVYVCVFDYLYFKP